MEDVYRDFEKHLEIYFRLVSMASFIVLKAQEWNLKQSSTELSHFSLLEIIAKINFCTMAYVAIILSR
jgi:hypothetical protein